MSLISDLYKIKKNDIKKAANVIVNAFSEDPMWKKVFKEEEMYRVISEVMVKFPMKYGNVFSTSDNLEGVMGIMPPDKDMTVWRIIRCGAFFLSMKLVKLRKEMELTEKKLKEEKKNLNLGPHIYLLIIGVSQEFQGKVFGGKLLRAIVEKAEIERKPIYLETQTESNVKLYEKYGFHVTKEIILPELNLPMWLMVRDVK